MCNSSLVIDQTKKWINDVVIGCNFCPFAAKVIRQKAVHFQVETSLITTICINALLKEVNRLDENISIETIFLIFPESFKNFDDYLELVSLSEDLLRHRGYEGIYQLASFHPLYRFEGSTDDDPANYTNRSVYPMLHLLREASIDKALEKYNDPEDIPNRNITFSRKKGLAYMNMLFEGCKL